MRTVSDRAAGRPLPLLVKIAPDLADDDVVAVADLVLEVGLDGVVATNTTISRDGLRSHPDQVAAVGDGGLSGRPLAVRATAVLRLLRERLGPDPTLIGVGGISHRRRRPRAARRRGRPAAGLHRVRLRGAGLAAAPRHRPRPPPPGDHRVSFGDYQNELYLGALGGTLPAHPIAYDELEAAALAALPPELKTYIAGGSGTEATQRANVAAFDQWALVPRMLRATAERDTSVELFGTRLASPLMMAPVGVLGLVTADQHGDIHGAEAAAATGVPFIGSTLMSDPLEDVVPHTGDTPAWFQLYTPKNRELAQSLVSRAERAGYEAIVVTLDTWVPGWRPRDLASGNFPQLRGKALANYTSDPVFQEMTGPDPDLGTLVLTWVGTFGGPLTWDDLAWLRSLTDLPLVLKGICHPDDARRALDEGADGIYCSNHGGRQANGGGGAVDWLPGVVDAVRVGERHRARRVRLRRAQRCRRRQGARPRRHRGRRRPALRLRPRPGRRARPGAPAALDPGRDRPGDGGRRLPDAGRPRAGRRRRPEASPMTFGARFVAALAERGPFCVGIDPHSALLHEWGLDDDVAGLETFARTVVEAVAPVCAVVKPQSAFYERFGSRGIAVLERVLADARAAGALALLDVKRGDIGSTTQAYAEAYLDPASPMAADAITVSPYLGFGSLDPFVETARRHDAGLFVLALTSNKEGPEFQHARVEHTGRTVGATVLDHLRELNAGAEPLGSFGAVVGATIGDPAAIGADLAVQRADPRPRLRRPGRHRHRHRPDLRPGGRPRDAELEPRGAPRRPRRRRRCATSSAPPTRRSPGDGHPRARDPRRAHGDRERDRDRRPEHRRRRPRASPTPTTGSPPTAPRWRRSRRRCPRRSPRGRPPALLEALPSFEALRDEAPDDIADDWATVVRRITVLRDALDDAGVDPSTYDPKKPPTGVTEAERTTIAAAATALAARETQQAFSAVQQEVRDVCGTPLSM